MTATIPYTKRVRRRALGAAAIAATMLLAGCLDARTAPDRLPPVRIVTSATVSGSAAAAAIRAEVSYHRITGTDTTSVLVDTAQVSLTGQTDQLVLDLDIGPCLADANREKAATSNDQACILYVRLMLLDANGGIIDDETTGPITTSPGMITSAPPTVLGTPVGSVVVTPAPDTIRTVGSGHQLGVTVLDTHGAPIAGATPQFLSLDTTIVTTTNDGFVQAKAPGSAQVVATWRERADTIAVVVRQVAAKASGGIHQPNLATGDTSSYVIAASDSNGVAIPPAELTVRYSSADTTVATVDSLTGLVKGVGIGTTTITAQFRVIHTSAQVTVLAPRALAQLALGAFHTCRLDAATHSVDCWGADQFGQLGAGNVARFATPDTLAGGVRLASVSGSSANGLQTCGLATSGTVYCWGVSLYGPVFDGSLIVRMVPTAIAPATTFTQVVTGSSLHSSTQWACALDASSQAWCWGDNDYGQLGDGTVVSHGDPALVSGGIAFAQLAAGDGFMCGLASTQVVYCWGDGTRGQTGDSSLTLHTTPTAINSLPPITHIAAGGSVACGLDANGGAWCWGDDSQGQMGMGSATGVQQGPVQAAGGATFSSLTIGLRHTCGITTGGVAECWGFGMLGQLGDGSSTTQYAPVTVAGGITFTALSAGRRHTCGLDGNGTMYCWGGNVFRQLGDGTNTPRGTPTAVAGGHSFVAMSASNNTTCAVDGGGVGYCWGTGYDGVASSLVLAPKATFAGLSLEAIESGIQFSCALTTAGQAYCAGDNTLGMLGDGTGLVHATPSPVLGSYTFTDLALATNSACGVTPSGVGLCWGENTFAQLGDGTTEPRTSPTTVWGGIPFRHVVASLTSSCGLATSGKVYCWGLNSDGQLGNGSTTPTPMPTQVSGGLTFGSVSVGPLFACGLANGGVAYCWGNNSHGQLGDGTNTMSLVPKAVATNLRFVQLDTRGAHVCALTSSGAAYCWGDNFAGQLGDGTNTDRNVPTLVAGANTFVHIATGAAHSCGLTDQGATLCWGWNVAGQLGDGSLADSNVPVTVP